MGSSVWGLVLLVLMCGGLSGVACVKFLLQSINFADKTHYADCQQLRDSKKYNVTGLYTLNLNETYQYQVTCEFTAHYSFTVIHRRAFGLINFAKPYDKYVNGFGLPTEDYWVGLNQIYNLTSIGNNVLTINLTDWDNKDYYVRYTHFSVLNASTSFRLQISGYQGTLKDNLSFNNGMNFSTFDKPDPSRCAVDLMTGWWFNNCSYALPTGRYYYGGAYKPSGRYPDGVYWKDWHGYEYSLMGVTMSVSKT